MELCYAFLDRAAGELGCPCVAGEPMSRHTTFQIGGPADRFITVETLPQLKGLVKALGQEGLPFLLLGKGSNLLVGDRGFRGAVLLLSGDFKKGGAAGRGPPPGRSGGLFGFRVRLCPGRGVFPAWSSPGASPAPRGGGGLYGRGRTRRMKDVVERVCHLTPRGRGSARGEESSSPTGRSRYTGGREIITFVEYRLQPGDPAQIAAKMEELMARRKEKQPYDMPSAGSVFKRPQGAFAAALIEECGLKGRRVGGAQVSEKHAGFIVNTGGATCADVLALIRQIQEEVYEKRGIRLETEVRVTGEQ